jgi:hypothetical protein
MKLKKISSENIKTLGWFDTIYILGKPLENPSDNPNIIQILSFSEGDKKFDLLEGDFYCSNAIRLI